MTLSSGLLAFLSNGRIFRKLYETVHVSCFFIKQENFSETLQNCTCVKHKKLHEYLLLLTNNLTIVDYINHDLKNNEKFVCCMNV